jgi:hypothetical protein
MDDRTWRRIGTDVRADARVLEKITIGGENILLGGRDDSEKPFPLLSEMVFDRGTAPRTDDFPHATRR